MISALGELVSKAVAWVGQNIAKVAGMAVTTAFLFAKQALSLVFFPLVMALEALQRIAGLTSMATPEITATLQSWFDQANFFFPLDTALVYAVTLSALWAACWVYRLVKSWVPTVS